MLHQSVSRAGLLIVGQRRPLHPHDGRAIARKVELLEDGPVVPLEQIDLRDAVLRQQRLQRQARRPDPLAVLFDDSAVRL